MRLLHYLFPRLRLKDKIPYGYRRYSGDSSAYGAPPEQLKFVLRRMIGYDVARTEADAYRLIRRHPDLSPDQIIAKYRRGRKRHVLRAIWRRFKALWIVLVIMMLVGPGRLLAQSPKDVYGVVTAVQANVRSGPGLDQAVIGKLNRGAKFAISAITSDKQWLYFKYWDKDGYISVHVVKVADGLDMLPTIEQSAPKGPQPGPHIVLAEYAVNPPVPRPNTPFDITLTLRNVGQDDAGLFSLATTFAGGAFVYATVPKIAVGETVQIAIRNPGEPKTGRFKSQVAIDVDNQLGPMSDSSLAEIVYRIDHPTFVQNTLKIDSYINVDLYGGTPDFAIDSQGISPLNGSKIKRLNVSVADIHYDLLAIDRSETIKRIDLKPGAIFAVITAEGKRGVLRVSATDTVQYFLYED